jgi:hypothetical protein
MNIKRSITFELTKQKKDGVLIEKNHMVSVCFLSVNKK